MEKTIEIRVHFKGYPRIVGINWPVALSIPPIGAYIQHEAMGLHRVLYVRYVIEERPYIVMAVE